MAVVKSRVKVARALVRQEMDKKEWGSQKVDGGDAQLLTDRGDGGRGRRGKFALEEGRKGMECWLARSQS